jgi:hypothetical protein
MLNRKVPKKIQVENNTKDIELPIFTIKIPPKNGNTVFGNA